MHYEIFFVSFFYINKWKYCFRINFRFFCFAWVYMFWDVLNMCVIKFWNVIMLNDANHWHIYIVNFTETIVKFENQTEEVKFSEYCFLFFLKIYKTQIFPSACFTNVFFMVESKRLPHILIMMPHFLKSNTLEKKGNAVPFSSIWLS